MRLRANQNIFVNLANGSNVSSLKWGKIIFPWSACAPTCKRGARPQENNALIFFTSSFTTILVFSQKAQRKTQRVA